MKQNKKNTKRLIQRLCGLVGLYIMMVVVCGTGMFLIHASENTLLSKTENTTTSVDKSMFPVVSDSTNLYVPKNMEEVTKEIEEKIAPVYKEHFVRIKDGVDGLNIRKQDSMDSDIRGVMYNGEISIAYIPYVLDEVVLGEWVQLSNGYVKSEYIEIIEEPIDLLEYRLTPKGTYTKNPILSYNVTQKSYVSATDLAEVTEGTELEGIEHAVVTAEDSYGINGLFVYAVATLESGNGTSDIARAKNNLFGMNAQDHDPFNLAFSYDSFHESVLDFADRIQKYYINQGLTDIYSINTKYSSDPQWHSKVMNIMERTYQSIID